jgi:hypothetical protein
VTNITFEPTTTTININNNNTTNNTNKTAHHLHFSRQQAISRPYSAVPWRLLVHSTLASQRWCTVATVGTAPASDLHHLMAFSSLFPSFPQAPFANIIHLSFYSHLALSHCLQPGTLAKTLAFPSLPMPALPPGTLVNVCLSTWHSRQCL